MLPLEYLLPLRAVQITLQFTEGTAVRLFHQPALTAWLRYLVGEVEIPNYEQYFTLDAPESGHTIYQAGDYYRFVLLSLRGGESLLQWLLERLFTLPYSVMVSDPAMSFRDNLVFVSAEDLWQQYPVTSTAELTPYTLDDLRQAVQFWQGRDRCLLRWLSPVRLLLPPEQREGYKGEQRYCRQRSQVNFSLLNNRLHDTFAHLLRSRVDQVPPRLTDESMQLLGTDLFWVDCNYHNTEALKPMGGLLGQVILDTSHFSEEQWLYWVLGQYLGIGQRRAFGWGRYQLETLVGEHRLVRGTATSSLLEQVCTLDNLQTAYTALQESGAENSAVEDEDLEVEILTDRLTRCSQKLLQGDYEIPALREYALPKEDGTLRWLKVPPFFDRVLQRAVTQVIAPALDTLMYEGSFGFRRGRSRHSATRMIQMAYQQGYRWVFEADIDDFFDNISWNFLMTRLTAFFGDDPLVRWIQAWIQAPVVREGQVIARNTGLPQGSPLSPLLANIMLDDFDRDLEYAGLRLVRFADDFVVLCRTQEEAEAVAVTVVNSLAEVGLQLNPHKTAVRSFAQGIRFLGYLFVNGLALDVGGEKSPQNVKSPFFEKIPPQSPLLQRGVGGISKTQIVTVGSITGKFQTPLQIGELNEIGTMVFVSGPPTVISTLDERLQVTRTETEKETTALLLDLPWRTVQAVTLLGGAHHITTPALRAALRHEVVVHFANSSGHYQGSTWNASTGNAASQLWLAQVAWFGQEMNQLHAAQRLVVARLRHQREVLRLRNLKHPFDGDLERLERLIGQSRAAIDLDQLRGFEGQGAQCYFQALSSLLPAWTAFDGRHRRPPPDPFNALLSLGYTILFAYIETIVTVNGLLPWVGLYHQPHGNHPVLVSDLIEPFRHLVERVALNVLSKHQLRAEDFFMTESEGCRLQDEARRFYLAKLSERFETPFQGYPLETSEKLYSHLQWQVNALRLWIRGQQTELKVWQMS